MNFIQSAKNYSSAKYRVSLVFPLWFLLLSSSRVLPPGSWNLYPIYMRSQSLYIRITNITKKEIPHRVRDNKNMDL